MRFFSVIATTALAVTLGGCAIQRAQQASDAQTKMIGLSKEQVLACMGPPANKAVEGATEVWSYNSGNNQTTVSTFGTSNTNASVSGNRNYAPGQASTTSSGFGVARSRFCTVNVTMINGQVSRINYVGPTGGLLTQGEQCAFVVQNCLQ
jgi:hypothetical protein